MTFYDVLIRRCDVLCWFSQEASVSSVSPPSSEAIGGLLAN